MEKTDYYFDKAQRAQAAYRSRSAAESEIAVLLKRLEVKPAHADLLRENPETKRLLVRYCMDFPLNIAWYEEARQRETWWQRAAFGLVLMLALIALGLTAAPAVVPRLFGDTATQQSTTSAQIVVILTGMFGVLSVVSEATDRKARIGGFWKAAADLKEALFTFEESWRDKDLVITTDGKKAISPELVAALVQEIRFARKVSREERTTYFNTFRSPTDVMAAANAALGAIRGRRGELLSAHREESATKDASEASAEKRIRDLRDRLVEATATVMSLERKITELESLGVEAAQIAKVKLDVVNARTEMHKVQSLLTLSARADVTGAP